MFSYFIKKDIIYELYNAEDFKKETDKSIGELFELLKIVIKDDSDSLYFCEFFDKKNTNSFENLVSLLEEIIKRIF